MNWKMAFASIWLLGFFALFFHDIKAPVILLALVFSLITAWALLTVMDWIAAKVHRK